MSVNHRRILSYVLLAIYGGISILGDGLHLLTHEAGHHHGLNVVCRAIHGHADADHDNCHNPECSFSDVAEYGSSSADKVVTASGCASDSHVCEACAFLSQALSQPAEVAAPIDWQPLVVAAASRPESIYSPTSVGPHAPRGPPLFFA
jgi:hypothetical protein